MKLKNILTFLVLVLMNHIVFSQLKVKNNGYVGIGTNDPIGNLHVNGRIFLTGNGNTFRFVPDNPGTEIGTSSDNIYFWYSWGGYNKLYAEQFYKQSDISLKSNIGLIQKPLDKIAQLKPYLYDVKDNYITKTGDSLEGSLRQYGFISQEVEKTLSDVDITQDMKEIKLMDYDQIIPLLVAGMQEQQKTIKAMEAKIAKLIATNPNYNSNAGGNGNGNVNNNPMDVSKLFSCSPNPFSSSATLSYYLCANTIQAELKVYDMQGIERKIFNLIPNQGNGAIILYGQDLPTSGTYIFALFVDSQIIDAKTIVKQ